MTLPSKYQNGNIDSSVKGVYRASPVKLMIYGNGMLHVKAKKKSKLLTIMHRHQQPTR
jgi:hypothetical protein